MKENKKAVKRVKKAMALFSKLRGLGVVGFSDHRFEKKDETILRANENAIVQNKLVNSLPPCQHQKFLQRCQTRDTLAKN